MPSIAWGRWETERAAALDEIAHAHAEVGGTGPGRRYATQHLNQAYAVLVASHFQGFCRDLHDECIDRLVAAVNPAGLQVVLHDALRLGRKLDAGNPNPGNLGSDFGRFDLAFWDAVYAHDARNEARREHLDNLNQWRNAIAHQNLDPAVLGSTTVRLGQVRSWRQACHQLGRSFDEVMRIHLRSILGVSPW